MIMEDFIRGIPKAELHIHIEGTLEPELIFEIAKRNNLKLNYNTVTELKEAYRFNNLVLALAQRLETADLILPQFRRVRVTQVVPTHVFDRLLHLGSETINSPRPVHNIIVGWEAKGEPHVRGIGELEDTLP